jgi:hypothetical protein
VEKYLEINYGSPIKIIIKDWNVLSYVKKVLEDNFKFKIIVQEWDLGTNTTMLELSKDIDLETFNKHFSVITEDVLKKQSKS